MAYKVFEDYAADAKSTDQSDSTKFSAAGQDHIDLPQEGIIQNAELSRDGTSLILETDSGPITIEGYFESSPAPDLIGPDGMRLTPELVESFITSPMEYADAGLSTSDATPIGAIQEITGTATITRANGTVETVGLGTPVFQGDVVETDESGAVNIMFIDETTFAVSEDARLSIDEYVFDPATQSGTTNFSVLKGVFVFTSGLIGRDDPDDVMINTPSGSIGIRGTIIAGDVDAGEITVIEGAIVLHDFAGNSITLANQFETARFNSAENEIEHIGDLSANDVVSKFMSVSTVAADLFSSIEDTANDTQQSSSQQENNAPEQSTETQDNQQEQQNTEESQAQETTPSEEQKAETSDESDDGETEGEGEATVPTETQEEQETKENTQANSSETEVAEVITSEEISNQKINPIHQARQNRVQNNDTENNETNSNGVGNTQQAIQNDADDSTTPTPGPIQTVRALDSAADEFFSGSTNSFFSYNFSQEFSNPLGTINSYTISGVSSQEISGPVTFNNATGQLDFALDSLIASNSSFDFTVTANTDLGSVSSSYTFDILAESINGSPSGGFFNLNADSVFNINGDGRQINANGNNVSIFGDGSDDSVRVNGPDALVKAGGGADTIRIGTSGNYNVYGEAGDDRFLMNGGSLNALPSNTGQIDGGTGFDTLVIGNSGNLNFANLTPNFVNNVEKIHFDNSNANQITLSYSDVVRMTDGANRLEIDLDANDTLNFVNNPGNSFVNNGIDGLTGFTEFTDGNITILVDDTQAANVTGL